MACPPYAGPWDLSPGGHDPSRTVYDGLADLYRACQQAGLGPIEAAATKLWKLGAILRPAKQPEDETLDVFAERIAAAEGRGPEPEARTMPMAQVIEITQRMKGATS